MFILVIIVFALGLALGLGLKSLHTYKRSDRRAPPRFDDAWRPTTRPRRCRTGSTGCLATWSSRRRRSGAYAEPTPLASTPLNGLLPLASCRG